MGNTFDIENCQLCPRECAVNRRSGEMGYCNCGSTPLVASVFLHQGEEPVLSGDKGICNVFFAHCNLQCAFCQNYQISNNKLFENDWITSYDEILSAIIHKLDRGVNLLGFVSPSHQVYQMINIIEGVKQKGYSPKIVYNTNCYDKVDTLKSLEGIVDIYLPDFKYFDSKLGKKYSNVQNYFEVASLAFKEMYWQKGSALIINDEGAAESGIIVRHLVLPGHTDDSIQILDYLANEFSSKLHISLMAQYYPTINVDLNSPIKRVLSQIEYNKVLKKIEECGFRGWIQELKSSEFYRPDFKSSTPFKQW